MLTKFFRRKRPLLLNVLLALLAIIFWPLVLGIIFTVRGSNLMQYEGEPVAGFCVIFLGCVVIPTLGYMLRIYPFTLWHLQLA